MCQSICSPVQCSLYSMDRIFTQRRESLKSKMGSGKCKEECHWEYVDFKPTQSVFCYGKPTFPCNLKLKGAFFSTRNKGKMTKEKRIAISALLLDVVLTYFITQFNVTRHLQIKISSTFHRKCAQAQDCQLCGHGATPGNTTQKYSPPCAW